MCCTIAAAGLECLAAHVPRDQVGLAPPSTADAHAETATPSKGVARRDVHAAAWAFALERALHAGPLRAIGPQHAPLSPPARSDGQARAAIGPAQLRLGGGRVPHNFVRIGAGGERSEVDGFETVRPALRLEVVAAAEEGVAVVAEGRVAAEGEARRTVDLLVELDDRHRLAGWRAKLQRYDHFLAGWSAHLRRYGRDAVEPFVVFICRDRGCARECARSADGSLLASRAYAGARPTDWLYPGRERIFFIAERDVHEGLLGAYVVQRLPPQIRVSAAGDERLRAAGVQTRALPLSARGPGG